MGKRTPLYDVYKDYPGVKLVDFAGWELPLHFETGIIAEHMCVRRAAGLFDVSHMGEIEIEGPDAVALVDWLVTNDVASINVGQAVYTPMCYPHAGVVDDLLVYRLAETRLMLVVNAANTEKDLRWISRENPWMQSRNEVGGTGGEGNVADLRITDRSDDTALIAFQGPRASELLRQAVGSVVDSISAFEFVETSEVFGRAVILSRTGYTGEDGFEIFAQSQDAAHIWTSLMELGGGREVLPCGLGARDTLRIEARLPLYGQELSSEISPLEGGLKPFVKLEKSDFCGKAALLEMKNKGVPRSLRGFRMIDKGVPRPGYSVYVGSKKIGTVTSGLRSPMLDAFVGLVLADSGVLEKGMTIEIDDGRKRKRAEVVATPFYRSRGRKG